MIMCDDEILEEEDKMENNSVVLRHFKDKDDGHHKYAMYK